MTDQCSVWAYQEIRDSGSLGEKHSMYLSVFAENPLKAYTAREATAIVKEKFGITFPVSSYVARVSDLEQMGFLSKFDVVPCMISGKRVNRWIYTGRKEPFPSKIEEHNCPRCKGTSKIKKKVYIHG